MSTTTHTTTFSAIDETSAVLKNIGDAAASAGVKVAAASGVIEQSADSLDAVAQSAGNAKEKLTSVSTVTAGTGKQLAELKEKSASAAGGAKTLAAATDGVAEASRKAAKEAATFGDKWKDVASVTANTVVSVSHGLAIVKDLAGALAKPFELAIRVEDFSTRLAPLVGGVETSRELVEHLRKEAANGTMSLEQLTSVAGRLAGTFSSAENIKTWTTAFHNLSAGTGLDINELVGNFAKMRAAGRVTGEFAEMFAQKGINIFGELSASTGKTAAELRKMAAAGTLSFGEIEKAILAVATGEGKFAGMAAKMSGTFGGSVGTMKAEWDILLSKFAEPIAETLTPMIQKLTQGVVKLTPVFTAFGSAASAVLENFTISLGISTTAAMLMNKRLRELTVSRLLGIYSQIKKLPAAFTAARVAVSGFGITFKSVMIAAKAALVSTGIGIAVVAVGEALGWLYGKMLEGGDVAAEFEASVKEIEAATAGLENRFADAVKSGSVDALRDQLKQEEKTWEERLKTFEEGSDEYKAFMEKYAVWRKEAFLGLAEAEEQIEAQRLEAQRKAQAEEIRAMQDRADALEDEISRWESKIKNSQEDWRYQLKVELRFDDIDLDKIDQELEALRSLSELTKEQEERAKSLLNAKKRVYDMEQQANAAAKSLRDKVDLLKAELEGNEKLLKVKEKLYHATLKEQYIQAGYSALDADAKAWDHIELEEEVERKRKREAEEKERKRKQEAADRARAEDDYEYELEKARAEGNKERIEELTAWKKREDLIEELTEKLGGDEKARAEAIARADERLALTKNGKAGKGAEVERRAVSGAATAAAGESVVPARSVSAGMGASLIDVNVAIRDNTKAILDVLRRGFEPQKVLVNPVLA